MSIETEFLEEVETEDPFRPVTWDELIGQHALKQRLRVAIASARKRKATLDHILLMGPPGVGKTSMSRIIADSMGYGFVSCVKPPDDKAMVRLISQHTDTVVLLDEIHRASKARQEGLLSLIEDGYYEDRRGNRHEPVNLTFIGATTEHKDVIKPLRDRFTIKPEFEEYSQEEMGQIVAGMATRMNLDLDEEFCVGLGRATGGVPRNAREFILACRDLELVYDQEVTVEGVLEYCGVDEEGLGTLHRRYIRYLQLNQTAGVNVMASVLGQNVGTVEQLEHLLVKLGYMAYTSSGRELTKAGFAKAKRING